MSVWVPLKDHIVIIPFTGICIRNYFHLHENTHININMVHLN